MLGIDPKAARATWTVILIALLCLVIYSIRETFFIFIVSLLFAYLLPQLPWGGWSSEETHLRYQRN